MNNKMTMEQAEIVANALLAGEPRWQNSWLGQVATGLVKHRRLGLFIVDSARISNVVEPVDFFNPGHAYWDAPRKPSFDGSLNKPGFL